LGAKRAEARRWTPTRIIRPRRASAVDEQDRGDGRRVVEPQVEVADPGETQHEVRRLTARDHPAGPQVTVEVDRLDAAVADGFGHAAVPRVAEDVCRGDEELGVAP